MNKFEDLYNLLVSEAPISSYLKSTIKTPAKYVAKKAISPTSYVRGAGALAKGTGAVVKGAGTLAGKAAGAAGGVLGKTAGLAGKAVGAIPKILGAPKAAVDALKSTVLQGDVSPVTGAISSGIQNVGAGVQRAGQAVGSAAQKLGSAAGVVGAAAGSAASKTADVMGKAGQAIKAGAEREAELAANKRMGVKQTPQKNSPVNIDIGRPGSGLKINSVLSNPTKYDNNRMIYTIPVANNKNVDEIRMLYSPGSTPEMSYFKGGQQINPDAIRLPTQAKLNYYNNKWSLSDKGASDVITLNIANPRDRIEGAQFKGNKITPASFKSTYDNVKTKVGQEVRVINKSTNIAKRYRILSEPDAEGNFDVEAIK